MAIVVAQYGLRYREHGGKEPVANFAFSKEELLWLEDKISPNDAMHKDIWDAIDHIERAQQS